MQPFLTANWRYLAMLNFVVDPRLLAPFVPPGTEIDFENGETFISVVGLLFLDTRLRGLPIPLHRDFEEVNLRFYVRKKSADTWRRGVVFIRELVPRRAITLIARVFYGERYFALPMKHRIDHVDLALEVEYSWRRGGKWESLQMSASGEPQSILAGSHAEFITEHYWGYTCVRGRCSEYRVEHPRWKIWQADHFAFRADVAALYGQQFVETLTATPRSTFIAEGSFIEIHQRELL
ncbi:MAG: YqjF family protein [Chthoniobacterales bacterium]